MNMGLFGVFFSESPPLIYPKSAYQTHDHLRTATSQTRILWIRKF